MKLQLFEDRAGYMRGSLIRDSDGPEMAPFGIQVSSPDLDLLNWEGIKQEVHNALMRAELFTWEDVIQGQNMVSGIVCRIVKAHIIRQYRQEHQMPLQEVDQ